MDANNKADGHVGMAAIVGRPNVGKSTLLNQLLGEKLAIVSHRPQTTRNRIVGIKTWKTPSGVHQLVLLDTPGIHRRRANLNRFMVEQALGSTQGVDCILLVTEVQESQADLHPLDTFVLEQIRSLHAAAPIIVVVNKVDRVEDKRQLLPLMAAWRDRGFEIIVPISALQGEGIEDLLDETLRLLPAGPPLYPEDMLTDQPERFFAAELIREQVFKRCREEIPYATAVEVESFDERAEQGDVCISAILHVEQESQKAILIGKRGSMIKAIGTAARQEISQLLGCPVHLQLSVHVEAGWSRSPQGRRKMGYE